jgi:hypothetical protein
MRLLYVPLSEPALIRLRESATRNRRRPQDEAAVLLESVLGLRKESASPVPLPSMLSEDPKAVDEGDR